MDVLMGSCLKGQFLPQYIKPSQKNEINLLVAFHTSFPKEQNPHPLNHFPQKNKTTKQQRQKHKGIYLQTNIKTSTHDNPQTSSDPIYIKLQGKKNIGTPDFTKRNIIFILILV